MLNICLCDDDINELDYYSNKINELSRLININVKIKTFQSGESLIFELENNYDRFDLIIIDIVLKRINGIEAGITLRKFGYKGIIIFLTSSEDFALEAFKAEPLNYIVKGKDVEEKLNKVLLKAIEKADGNSKKKIVISNRQINKILDVDNIVYIESINKKVIIHSLFGEKEEINCTLNVIYEKVKIYGFIRCHKSYIVNSKYIQSFSRIECKLKNQINIPIGRKYSKTFESEFLEHEINNLLLL